MYRFSTNVKKIIHNDKLVLINLNTGQWIRMSMTVYKIIDKFIVKNVVDCQVKLTHFYV